MPLIRPSSTSLHRRPNPHHHHYVQTLPPLPINSKKETPNKSVPLLTFLGFVLTRFLPESSKMRAFAIIYYARRSNLSTRLRPLNHIAKGSVQIQELETEEPAYAHTRTSGREDTHDIAFQEYLHHQDAVQLYQRACYYFDAILGSADQMPKDHGHRAAEIHARSEGAYVTGGPGCAGEAGQGVCTPAYGTATQSNHPEEGPTRGHAPRSSSPSRCLDAASDEGDDLVDDPLCESVANLGTHCKMQFRESAVANFFCIRTDLEASSLRSKHARWNGICCLLSWKWRVSRGFDRSTLTGRH
jgi:hypothetical protein